LCSKTRINAKLERLLIAWSDAADLKAGVPEMVALMRRLSSHLSNGRPIEPDSDETIGSRHENRASENVRESRTSPAASGRTI
jgi:hypothetical protein